MEPSAVSTTTKVDQRLDQARVWITELGIDTRTGFHPITGDASFRRYFRLQANGESRILMDAPPPAEDVTAFMDIDRRLRSAGLHAPQIVHANRQQGFLLLEDLGDDIYRGILHADNADEHFFALFDVLKTMALQVNTARLPVYDGTRLRNEMDLFPEWYLGRHRTGIRHARFDAIWDKFCDRIIVSAVDQPRCFVHRDFHSCNLIRTRENSVGIIDFQDAVTGPLSYDFVSLIWDRYISWPRQQIEHWMEKFRVMLGLDITPRQWLRYCDLMGLQRNFKIVGIFARLYYRDGKNGYIEMIPRFHDYLTDTLHRYPEFTEILKILEQPECAP